MIIFIIMSASSLSAAKRRRAGVQISTPPTPPVDNVSIMQTNQKQAKIPIQNYLTTLEKRVMGLEQKLNEEQGVTNLSFEIEEDGEKKTIRITDFMEGLDLKIQLLADEIANLKDAIIGLQKFTMEVNVAMSKKLLEDSIEYNEKEI